MPKICLVRSKINYENYDAIIIEQSDWQEVTEEEFKLLKHKQTYYGFIHHNYNTNECIYLLEYIENKEVKLIISNFIEEAKKEEEKRKKNKEKSELAAKKRKEANKAKRLREYEKLRQEFEEKKVILLAEHILSKETDEDE